MPIYDSKCPKCEHIEKDRFHSHWSENVTCPECSAEMVKMPALIRWNGDPTFTYAEMEYNGKIVDKMRIPRPEKPKDPALKRGPNG